MPPRRPRTPTASAPEAPLEDRLARLDKSELVTLAAELAARDHAAHQYVERALNRPPGPDLPYYRRWFSSALGRRPWVPRHEAAVFVHDVNAAISGIESLLATGHASAVISLTEYALQRLDKRLLSVDDSDGNWHAFFARLEALHLAACTAAPPPTLALARRLFEWEFHGDWNTFLGKIGSYAQVLGPKGLREYRRLADEAWDALPVPSPSVVGFDYTRSRLSIMRRAFAQQTGDPIEIVSAHHEGLSHPHAFHALLQALDEVGANDEIAQWGEAALAAYPGAIGDAIRGWMAAWHGRAGRNEEALALRWQNVVLNRTAVAYLALAELAQQMKTWDAWRPKAIEALRCRPDETIDQLVTALLGEGDVAAAWREAIHGKCSHWTLLDAARAQAVTHPAETISAYWQLVDVALEPTGKQHYRNGIALLHEVRETMERAGEGSAFAAGITALRATHKLRPTLIRMLDAARW